MCFIPKCVLQPAQIRKNTLFNPLRQQQQTLAWLDLLDAKNNKKTLKWIEMTHSGVPPGMPECIWEISIQVNTNLMKKII
jgi:hypothetical protein